MALFSALSRWLSPTQPMKRRFTDIAELREFVIAAIVKEPGVDSAVADLSDPAKFRITGQLSSTGDLTNLFGYITAYPDEDADKLIERFIRSLTQAKTCNVSDERIVVVIRNSEYIEYLRGRGMDVLCEPLGADLMLTSCG